MEIKHRFIFSCQFCLSKKYYPTSSAVIIISHNFITILLVSFPSVFFYNRLRDDCVLVRKNTMMVLTHLILNDMVKVRGQISSMALCLKDEDSSIMDMAHMFFYELSLKVVINYMKLHLSLKKILVYLVIG